MKEDKIKPGSVGGKANAKISKEQARIKYYNNPKYCKECGKIIELEDNRKASDIKKKKFCNRSCSAKYNNKKRKKIILCSICGDEIFKRVKYCIKCKKELDFNKYLNKTKGYLLQNTQDYFSFRSSICKNARYIFKTKIKNKQCKVCGYSKHIEVCHIKPVSEFDNSAPIYEINSIDNLIGLCPNCHWEFDNGLLII